MPTKLPHPALPQVDAHFLSASHHDTTRIKATQKDFYVLVGVSLGSLTLMTLAVAISAAIMLADANL